MPVTINEKRLKQLQKDLESFSQSSSIFLRELLNSNFMDNFTRFHSFEEFLKSGGYEFQNQMDFRNLSNDLFDAHVAQQTHNLTIGKTCKYMLLKDTFNVFLNFKTKI